AGQTAQCQKGQAGVLGGSRHPRRQRTAARIPRRPPSDRPRDRRHLRGHGYDPVADRRTRPDRDLRLHLTSFPNAKVPTAVGTPVRVEDLTAAPGAKRPARRRDPKGVEQPHSVRLAVADADLTTLSDGHLVTDATRSATLK